MSIDFFNVRIVPIPLGRAQSRRSQKHNVLILNLKCKAVAKLFDQPKTGQPPNFSSLPRRNPSALYCLVVNDPASVIIDPMRYSDPNTTTYPPITDARSTASFSASAGLSACSVFPSPNTATSASRM